MRKKAQKRSVLCNNCAYAARIEDSEGHKIVICMKLNLSIEARGVSTKIAECNIYRKEEFC